MTRMLHSTPARKVVAGSLGGAIGTILIWVLHDIVGLNPPVYVDTALVTVVVFVTGYFTPPSQNDQIVDDSR